MIVASFAAMAMAGTVARWQLAERLPPPVGTLVANLVGSFALGWLSGASAATSTVIGVAALGSFTTFSTLMLELVALWDARPGAATGYLALTIVGGVGLAWLGLSIS
ncbi:MAG: CrcB family protein [Acidimicrobiales bacterium]